MNTHLDELINRWREGQLSEEELRALTDALVTREGRAALRNDWFLEAALPEALRTAPVLKLAQKMEPMALPQARQWMGWLSWRPLNAAAAGVLLVGIISLLVIQRRAALDATLQFEGQGRVSVVREDRVQPVTGATTLKENDLVVVSGDGQPAVLLLDRGATRLTLQPGVRLRLLALAPQKVFQFDTGSLDAEVTKQPLNAPMRIHTPHAEARVLGTVFSLRAHTEKTGLTVESGVVRISQPDGSTEDVKTGQSAVALKGSPIRLVPRTEVMMPAAERPQMKWIKGPATWQPDGSIRFDFTKDGQDWILVKGTRWEAPGVLRLHQVTSGPGGKYKAVAPAIPVTGGQHIIITGKARVENGARLEMNYYQHDASQRCFGFARVPGDFTARAEAGFVTFQFELDTIASDELRYIAPILYCFHADRSDPQPGDVIIIDEVIFTRH